MLGLSDRIDALRAALLDPRHLASVETLTEILRQADPQFPRFLNRSGMGALWHQRLAGSPVAQQCAPQAMEQLRRKRHSDAALYSAQRACLSELDRLFAKSDIPYAVMKGAHVRELAYGDPALRPAGDIDILIAPADRQTAARALVAAGFEMHVLGETISHEATFCRGVVDIDLHWNLLRPGRIRTAMAGTMLERRVRVEDFCGLAETDATFLMLVHPAFAKHVNAPEASLASVADFVFWTRTRTIDWPAVSQLLQDGGVKTSAWAVLTWWSMLIGAEQLNVPAPLLTTLRPGPLRARYLEYWLAHDLPTRWNARRMLIQGAFTLCLHDAPSDAVRAVVGLIRARTNEARDSRILSGQ